MLGEAVINARVCDLFAGGGALGIEALSRGAREAVFVEKSPQVLKYLKDNLAGLENVRMIKGDVFRIAYLLRDAGFDIVLADPPYQEGLAGRTVKVVAQNRLVKINGWLVIEHRHQEILSPPAGWTEEKRRVYGESAVTFFRRQE